MCAETADHRGQQRRAEAAEKGPCSQIALVEHRREQDADEGDDEDEGEHEQGIADNRQRHRNRHQQHTGEKARDPAPERPDRGPGGHRR